MKVFIQSIVAQLLLNPYIYWRGRQALPQQKKWQVSYLLLFVLELCLYFFGFFFREDLPDSVFIPIMNICNTWYIGSIYITLGLLCLEVIRISQRKWKWLPRMISKHWQECKRILFILFVIGTTSLICSVPFESKFMIDSMIAVIAGLVLWFGTMKHQELRKPCGIIMLLCYGLYFMYLCLM